MQTELETRDQSREVVTVAARSSVERPLVSLERCICFDTFMFCVRSVDQVECSTLGSASQSTVAKVCTPFFLDNLWMAPV